MKYNSEEMEDLIIDYVEGRLSGDLRAYVEARIEKDADVRATYREYRELQHLMNAPPEEPPADRLALGFDQLLREAKQEQSRKRRPLRKLFSDHGWQIAASLLLVTMGVLIGRSWVGDSSDQELTAVKQDLQETRVLLQQVLTGDLTPSQRLQQVQTSYRLETADREILGALIRTMNTDDNANVRIAAIRALAGFTDDPPVRQALIQSLTTQEDPFIQMMLINLLVRIQEKRAVPQFELLIDGESTDQTVKDEAQLAIFQLS